MTAHSSHFICYRFFAMRPSPPAERFMSGLCCAIFAYSWTRRVREDERPFAT